MYTHPLLPNILRIPTLTIWSKVFGADWAAPLLVIDSILWRSCLVRTMFWGRESSHEYKLQYKVTHTHFILLLKLTFLQILGSTWFLRDWWNPLLSVNFTWGLEVGAELGSDRFYGETKQIIQFNGLTDFLCTKNWPDFKLYNLTWPRIAWNCDLVAFCVIMST